MFSQFAALVTIHTEYLVRYLPEVGFNKVVRAHVNNQMPAVLVVSSDMHPMVL